MQLCGITGDHSDLSCNCNFSCTEFSVGLFMYGESCNFTAHFLLQFPESLTRRLPDCSYSHTVSKTRILDNGPDRRTHPEPECRTGDFLNLWLLEYCIAWNILRWFDLGNKEILLVSCEWVGWGRLGSSRCMGLI